MCSIPGRNDGARTTARPDRRLLALALLAVLLLPLLASCGKKGWPEPLILQERFEFGNLYGVREGDCLVVKARLEGKWENMTSVRLEFSDTDIDCPTCPFHPSQESLLAMDDPELSVEDEVLTIRHCGLDPSATYRWRLVGYNVHEELEPETSEVRLTTP